MNQIAEASMSPLNPIAEAPPTIGARVPRAQPIALTEIIRSADPSITAAGPALLSSLNPLHQVRTTLQVCVGAATLTVGELLSAREEQVLVLDRAVHQPVDLMLEGQVVARGQLVAVGDHFAVRITELPLPLRLETPASP